MKAQDNSEGWPEGWLVAAAAAVLSAAMARLVGDLGLFATLLIAVFVFLVFGVLLGLFWGGPAADPHAAQDGHGHAPAAKAHGGAAHAGHADAATHSDAAAHPPMAAQPTAPAVAAEPAAPIAVEEPAPAPMPESAPDQPVVVAAEAAPVDPGTVQQPVAQPLMSEADEADDEEESVPNAPRRSREERVAARAAKAARQAAKAARAEQAAPATPAPVPEGGSKPQGLTAARGGVPDRLQTIEGIGPVLEKLCHELGIYHFDQIAGWGAAEIAWMDGNLKGFKGRVSRDKWVRQAALIGEVGMDEFLRRAKTNDY